MSYLIFTLYLLLSKILKWIRFSVSKIVEIISKQFIWSILTNSKTGSKIKSLNTLLDSAFQRIAITQDFRYWSNKIQAELFKYSYVSLNIILQYCYHWRMDFPFTVNGIFHSYIFINGMWIFLHLHIAASII